MEDNTDIMHIIGALTVSLKRHGALTQPNLPTCDKPIRFDKPATHFTLPIVVN